MEPMVSRAGEGLEPMLRFSTSKIVATIGFIVIGLLLAVPSLFTPQQRQAARGSFPAAASIPFRQTSVRC